MDRIFDRKRFDYRETLIEFSRGLSSQTDLETLARSVVERLSQTLLVSRVAIFLSRATTAPVRVFHAGRVARPAAACCWTCRTQQTSRNSFLNFGCLSQDHIFFENPLAMLCRTWSRQRSGSRLRWT